MNVDVSCSLRTVGFAVVSSAVPQRLAENVLGALEVRRNLLASLEERYPADINASGFFPLWNAASLWRIRESATVRSVFAQAHGHDRLWVSLDRCGVRLPGSMAQGRLKWHWDDDASRWDFAPFQGMVALTDNAPGEGGFVCAPDLFDAYRRLGRDVAIATLAAGAFASIDVPLKAGDLLIFDHRLAHRTALHRGDALRAVQYVAFNHRGDADELRRRVQCWQTGAWRGGKASPPYEIPDQVSPVLSEAGWRALTGVP